MKTLVITITEKGETYRKGNLTVDGRTIVSTLEPQDKGLTQETDPEEIIAAKLSGKCAIPYGTYEVVIVYSEKFKRFVPRLLNVPGFQAIEMHEGNSSKDSEGCILIGISGERGKDWINLSRTGNQILMNYLRAIPNEKIVLTIKPN